MSDTRHDYVKFKLDGGDSGGDVPVSILTQALLGFQQLAKVIGRVIMDAEKHAELGIDVFASSRVALHAELKKQIVMLWREYAMEDDANLSESALLLKRALLAAIVEAPHAEG